MKKLLFCLLLIGLGGCNKSSDSSGGTGIAGDTGGAGGSLADLNKATNGYSSSCSGGSIYEWKFESNKAIYIQKAHSGSCSSPLHNTKITYEATTEGTSAENTSATKINLKPIKFEMAILDSNEANYSNTSSACGKTDWVADGSYVDLTNNSCVSTQVDIYQIFKISGDTLTFGVVNASRDTTTPGMRPVELNGSFPYNKQ